MDRVKLPRTVFAVIILASIAGAVSAGEIRGVVTDSVSGTGISGVTVMVKGAPNQTVTDAQGIFTLTTPTGILCPEDGLPGPETAWEQGEGGRVWVYGANGIRLKSVAAGPADLVLVGLPDGMYLWEARKNGRSFAGQMIKIQEGYRAGRTIHAAGKAAAAVTLWFMKSGYAFKEQAAAEGDTNVAARLRAYGPPPTAATTGVPAGTALTDVTAAEVLVAPSGTTFRNRRVLGTPGSYPDGSCILLTSAVKGKTLNFANCQFASMSVITENYVTGAYAQSVAEMVTLNMTNCSFGSISSCNTFAGTFTACSFSDYCQLCTAYPMNGGEHALFPVTFRDCYWWCKYMPHPTHIETMQIKDWAIGMRFENCSFNQQGSENGVDNSGVTGVINWRGAGTICDNCSFLSDGKPAYYSAIYQYSQIGSPDSELNYFISCRFDERGGILAWDANMAQYLRKPVFLNCTYYGTGTPLPAQ